MRRAGPVLVALGALALPAPAGAVRQVLTLAPARAHGIARAGEVVGPLGLQNFTANVYSVRVLPTFLQQDRTGAVSVDQRPSVLRRARGFLTGRLRPHRLVPGSTYRVRSRVRRVTAGRNLYGGLIFEATPSGRSTSPIRQVIGLGASLYLDPPRALRRYDFAVAAPRAENRGRALLLVGTFRNAGNAYTRLRVRTTVDDASGRRVFAADARPLRLLPGFPVDFPVRVSTVLGAGVYRLTTTGTAHGRSWSASSTIRLFGPNQVATRSGRFAGPVAPSGYLGEPEHLEGRWRNTGNVPFAAGLSIEVRDAVGDRLLATTSASAGTAKPGATSSFGVDVKLPAGRQFQLTLRLLDGRRVLDSSEVPVSRSAKPSWLRRFLDWLREHALALVGGLLALVLVLLAVLATRMRRGRRADPPAGAGPPAPVEPPLADGLVDVNRAGASELERLPGVGPRAAARIVEHREEYGPFASLDDLAAVEGFDAERIAALRGAARAGDGPSS